MELKKYEKNDISCSLLEKALSIYEEGDNYFAALHLAAASEEILGKYLQAKGLQTSLESEKEALIVIKEKLFKEKMPEKEAINFLNKAKNAIKHMNVNDSNDKSVVMDPKEDAETMLERAITNWWRLGQELTPSMKKFWNRNMETKMAEEIAENEKIAEYKSLRNEMSKRLGFQQQLINFTLIVAGLLPLVAKFPSLKAQARLLSFLLGAFISLVLTFISLKQYIYIAQLDEYIKNNFPFAVWNKCPMEEKTIRGHKIPWPLPLLMGCCETGFPAMISFIYLIGLWFFWSTTPIKFTLLPFLCLRISILVFFVLLFVVIYAMIIYEWITKYFSNCLKQFRSRFLINIKKLQKLFSRGEE